MLSTVVTGIMLPFIGTALGSVTVLFMKKNRRNALTDCMSGFAGGVMLAASVWSLLLPALSRSEGLGSIAFLPSAFGFFLGTVFMIICEVLLEKLFFKGEQNKKRGKAVTAFAITVHNFPEGLAVGLVYAALLTFPDSISLSAAISLSLGIAIQNIPEGAIVSLPLLSERIGKGKAFLYGVLSGAVEPLGAVLTLFFAKQFSPLMPYLLSFAAGAMVFVVINELSEEMKYEKGKWRGMLFFALGFVIMMSLDVALG